MSDILTQLMALLAHGVSLVVLGDLLTADDRDRVRELAEALEATHPSIAITLTPETRGFEYHDRLGFVLFAPSVRGELAVEAPIARRMRRLALASHCIWTA